MAKASKGGQKTPASGSVKSATQQEASATGEVGQESAAASGKDAVELLRADHRKVESLFSQFERESEKSKKGELCEQICQELIVHTRLEEEIFYPACRKAEVEEDLLDEAQVEHDGAKVLIWELMEGALEEPFQEAKVSVLSEYIKHHVAEEEKPTEGIFARAKSSSIDLKSLGQQIQRRKESILAAIEDNGIAPPEPKALRCQQGAFKKNSMARCERGPERDEQGRFTSDDDRGYSRRRGSGGRYRDDENDDRGYRGRGRSGWYEDPEGHFEASQRGWEERRSSRGSSRSRYEEDDHEDDDRGRGGRRGGWFGDPEGHAEAGRSRWEDERSSRGSRSRYEDDDDGRRYSRSSRDDDYEEDDDNGDGRGWHGGPEGHSRAARQGRSRSDDDNGRRSRSDDESGRRGGRSSRGGGGRSGRGGGDQRGWFGDPRGHAEAARRGWRNRD